MSLKLVAKVFRILYRAFIKVKAFKAIKKYVTS